MGRISEGQFEFPELNGWMTPGQGQQLCDRQPQCGGFTYKVSQRYLVSKSLRVTMILCEIQSCSVLSLPNIIGLLTFYFNKL